MWQRNANEENKQVKKISFSQELIDICLKEIWGKKQFFQSSAHGPSREKINGEEFYQYIKNYISTSKIVITFPEMHAWHNHR